MMEQYVRILDHDRSFVRYHHREYLLARSRERKKIG